jgi:hypothetical protein
MWRVMRRRRVFSIDNLVIPLDGVQASNANRFINSLVRHGIVKFDSWSGKPGRPGSCKVFRLIRDLGPEQPLICPTCKKSLVTMVCEVSDDQR